jgi:hypothetical protein
MKKAGYLIVFLAFTTPAHAQLIHKIQSSVQLSVDAAASQTTRLGTSYAVSGTGVDTTDGTTAGVVGGFGNLTNGVPAITNITASQKTAGSAFSFSQSITQGDSTSATTTTLTNGAVTALPLLGQTTTTGGGVAGSLAGTVTSAHAVTATAGGAGTSVIGQTVTTLQIGD